MPEIGTSGLMSGERKRSVAAWLKLPRLSSTLPAHPGYGISGCGNCSPHERSDMREGGADCNPSRGCHVANHPRCIYKQRIVARTGEICMISMYLQIAPSRPMPVLDFRSL